MKYKNTHYCQLLKHCFQLSKSFCKRKSLSFLLHLRKSPMCDKTIRWLSIFFMQTQRKRKWKLSKYLLVNKILQFIVLNSFQELCFCAILPYQDFAVCNKKQNMVKYCLKDVRFSCKWRIRILCIFCRYCEYFAYCTILFLM